MRDKNSLIEKYWIVPEIRRRNTMTIAITFLERYNVASVEV